MKKNYEPQIEKMKSEMMDYIEQYVRDHGGFVVRKTDDIRDSFIFKLFEDRLFVLSDRYYGEYEDNRSLCEMWRFYPDELEDALNDIWNYHWFFFMTNRFNIMDILHFYNWIDKPEEAENE